MQGFLRFAFALSGSDAGQRLTDEASVLAVLRDETLGWLHLDADDPATRPWVEDRLGFVDSHGVAALLAQETRPRAMTLDSGVIVILRAINTDETEEPEDMRSVRLWFDPARIVSLSRRPVAELHEMAEAVEKGQGPRTAGAFLAALVERLNIRIDAFRRELDDACDEVEAQLIGTPEADLRPRMTELRQKVISFRRHVSPQRDAVDSLLVARPAILSSQDLKRLAEAHDRLTRTLEDLDAMRERLAVAKDELTAALSERLNRNLYILALISLVFLPLGFLTGLMGINLAGMPGADWPGAFWVFTGLVLCVVVVQLLWLRWRRWF